MLVIFLVQNHVIFKNQFIKDKYFIIKIMIFKKVPVPSLYLKLLINLIDCYKLMISKVRELKSINLLPLDIPIP
jgi:hypothetical protein